MSVKQQSVAVLGATGAVGRTMLRILEERDFPVGELRPFASRNSVGKTVSFQGEDIPLRTLEPGCFKGVDIALFSAGGSVSEIAAPQAADEGAVVIDNTAAFRYDPQVPLVVPEVNRADIFTHRGIIANPNCSTIQLLVALKPLHDAARLRRMVVSTYQAVSGAGWKAVRDLQETSRAVLDEIPCESKVFPHSVAFNALPHIDRFLEGGWTKEEMKMVWETRKMLHDDSIGVTATCVRVPVMSGHSESVYAEFEREIEVEEAWELWKNAPGVHVLDNTKENVYPLATSAAGTDPVYVGRARKDLANGRALNFWCVSDNLRKGAALNAVQIAECLIRGETA